MIEITRLRKQFGRTTVLNDISLQIGRGDRIALIGPNGAGKTTLIRSILGQYVVNGELTIFGKEPRQHREEILDRVGYVPQLPPPIQMSVRELVHFSASISSRSTVEEIGRQAEALGLDIDRNSRKSFQKLSGGMKQKLLIALALAGKPDVLIMDEPAANLDPQARQTFFLRLLQAMTETTMLLSSHRVDEISGLVNRIIEMDHGRVIQDEVIDAAILGETMLHCRVVLTRPHEAADRLFAEWNFSKVNGEPVYEGGFIGTERLRFLTSVSHFANHIKELSIN